MSTDDLSPMLPQPADDNAPMISGRGTKIIADARGAYLAGNLQALIEHLDHNQQFRLRRWLLQYYWAHVRHLLSDTDELTQFAFHEMLAWLRNPQLDSGEVILNRLIERGLVNPIPRGELKPEDLHYWSPDEQGQLLLGLARTIIVPSLKIVSNYIINDSFYAALPLGHRMGRHQGAGNAKWNPPKRAVKAANAAYKAQIDAAWAILQGKEPPPFVLEDSA